MSPGDDLSSCHPHGGVPASQTSLLYPGYTPIPCPPFQNGTTGFFPLFWERNVSAKDLRTGSLSASRAPSNITWLLLCPPPPGSPPFRLCQAGLQGEEGASTGPSLRGLQGLWERPMGNLILYLDNFKCGEMGLNSPIPQKE